MEICYPYYIMIQNAKKICIFSWNLRCFRLFLVLSHRKKNRKWRNSSLCQKNQSNRGFWQIIFCQERPLLAQGVIFLFLNFFVFSVWITTQTRQNHLHYDTNKYFWTVLKRCIYKKNHKFKPVKCKNSIMTLTQ